MISSKSIEFLERGVVLFTEMMKYDIDIDDENVLRWLWPVRLALQPRHAEKMILPPTK